MEESKDSVSQSTNDTTLEFRKQDLKEKMGEDIFNYYYDFLHDQRHNPNTDEAKLRAQLNEWIGNNKTLKNLIFEMEQLIFKEMQAELNSRR